MGDCGIPYGPQNRSHNKRLQGCAGDRRAASAGCRRLTLSRSHRLLMGFDFLITLAFFLAEFFLLADDLIKLRGIEVDILITLAVCPGSSLRHRPSDNEGIEYGREYRSVSGGSRTLDIDIRDPDQVQSPPHSPFGFPFCDFLFLLLFVFRLTGSRSSSHPFFSIRKFHRSDLGHI